MLLVILGHSSAFWTENWFINSPRISSKLIGELSEWIGSFHIYAFTLVSGYLFTYKITRGGYREYIPFLLNKAKRLLIPYAFVMTVWVAPISWYYFRWDLEYMLKKYILCINPSQLWFLWMLFWVFAIMWPLRNKITKEPVLGWAIAFFFWGIGSIAIKAIPNVFCIWSAFQYIPFFYLGIRIRNKEENKNKLIIYTVRWPLWILLDIGAFVLSLQTSDMTGVLGRVINIEIGFILNLLGAIMAFTSLQALARYIPWQNSKLFQGLSSFSMPMYLFHQQIIYFVIVWLNGKMNPWIHMGLNFIIALVGAFTISRILMKWNSTRFLIGEKS